MPQDVNGDGTGASPTQTSEPERHAFGAEVGRLLDLVVHSLYSEREIFLRELVANAADATDRRRFEALTNAALASANPPAIRITPDKPARTLTIADEGIGMSRDELAQNLGTIAKSGTRAFTATLAGAASEGANPEAAAADERPAMIGQFGVGFYAAFMVADRVEVTSRRAGTEEAWLWASDGRGEYTLAPASRDTAGTTIVLHMKADAEEYLEPYKLETVIRKWADHITIPVTIARDGKDVAANEGTALWRKPKADITEEAYTEFYRHIGHFFDQPWATLHWRAEGQLEFAACCSFRARGRSMSWRATAKAMSACTCAACSSPATPSCCRNGCASSSAWSIPRTCRSTSAAKCCRRPRCSRASAAPSPTASSASSRPAPRIPKPTPNSGRISAHPEGRRVGR